MYNTLFKELVRQIGIPQKKNFLFSKSDNTKIKKAISILDRYSKESNQHILSLIYTYAYFYISIFNNYNYSQVQLQVFKYLEHLKSTNLPIFTNEDCELAFQLFEVWNSLHQLTSRAIPFQLRKVLSELKIKIYKNTYFQHTSNYLHFFQMAHNINTNIKHFPKLHGAIEFFLHIPILNKRSGNYQTYQYLNMDTLDRYYRKYYDNVERFKRLRLFLRDIQITPENLEIYRKSKILGAQYAIIYVEEKLKERTENV